MIVTSAEGNTRRIKLVVGARVIFLKKHLPYLAQYHHKEPSKRACSLLRRDNGRRQRERQGTSISNGRGGRGCGMRLREGGGYNGMHIR